MDYEVTESRHGAKARRLITSHLGLTSIDHPGKTCWPRDLLKHDVKNIRVITWGYDSSVVKAFAGSSQASIFGHAEALLTDISSRRLRQGEVKVSSMLQ
jgi:hypothetical protein